MYNRIYILSNHGKTKNYIKKVFGGGFSFTIHEHEAVSFSQDDTKSILQIASKIDFDFYTEAVN